MSNSLKKRQSIFINCQEIKENNYSQRIERLSKELKSKSVNVLKNDGTPVDISKLHISVITKINDDEKLGNLIIKNPEELKHEISNKRELSHLLGRDISLEELETFHYLTNKERAEYEDFLKEKEISRQATLSSKDIQKLPLPKTLMEFKERNNLIASEKKHRIEKEKRVLEKEKRRAELRQYIKDKREQREGCKRTRKIINNNLSK